MKEIEDYLDRVCRGVAGSASLRQHIREELREHLLESRDRHLSDGLSDDDASRAAIEEFGEAKAVSEELQTIYGRRLVALLIEKAMAWREDTMKTAWKWSFITNLSLLLTVVLGWLLILSLLIYVVPMLFDKYHDCGEGVPHFAHHTWTSFFLPLTRWGVVWIPLLLIGVVAFERFYRGEQKPRIRLALGAVASLISMGLVFLATAAVAIPLAMLPPQKPIALVERMVLHHARQANKSFAQVKQVMEQDQPWHVGGYCSRLHRELRELAEDELTPLVLARLSQVEEVESTMETLRDVTDLSKALVWDKDVETNLPQLVAAYDDLVAKVGGWPQPDTEPKSPLEVKDP